MWWCEVDVKMKMEAMMARETKRSRLFHSWSAEFGARPPGEQATLKCTHVPTHQLELELSGHVIVRCTIGTLLHCVPSVPQFSVTGPMASKQWRLGMLCIHSENQMPSTILLCMPFIFIARFEIYENIGR